MKKIFLTATILFCTISAGCLQGGSNLIITDGGEVFMQNRLIGVPLVAEAIENFRRSFEQRGGAEISPVAENNMSGYEIRVHYPSIENFAAEGNPMFLSRAGKCKGIQLKRGWFFDAYNFDLIFTGGERKYSELEAATVQSMLSQVTFDLVMELPYAADVHNADKFDADKKFLTWHLAPVLIGSLADKKMHAQFKIWHREKIFLTALVGIIFFAATIFFAVKTRAEESESLAKDLAFKRNVFGGIFVTLMIISAAMLFAPITFTDAEIISAAAP